RQRPRAPARLPDKHGQPPPYGGAVGVEADEVQIAAGGVLFLVDQVIEQNVQAANPREVRIDDAFGVGRGQVWVGGGGEQGEHAQRGTGRGGEFPPVYMRGEDGTPRLVRGPLAARRRLAGEPPFQGRHPPGEGAVFV